MCSMLLNASIYVLPEVQQLVQAGKKVGCLSGTAPGQQGSRKVTWLGCRLVLPQGTMLPDP